jgi:hypothetical protein
VQAQAVGQGRIGVPGACIGQVERKRQAHLSENSGVQIAVDEPGEGLAAAIASTAEYSAGIQPAVQSEGFAFEKIPHIFKVNLLGVGQYG